MVSHTGQIAWRAPGDDLKYSGIVDILNTTWKLANPFSKIANNNGASLVPCGIPPFGKTEGDKEPFNIHAEA